MCRARRGVQPLAHPAGDGRGPVRHRRGQRFRPSSLPGRPPGRADDRLPARPPRAHACRRPRRTSPPLRPHHPLIPPAPSPVARSLDHGRAGCTAARGSRTWRPPTLNWPGTESRMAGCSSWSISRLEKTSCGPESRHSPWLSSGIRPGPAPAFAPPSPGRSYHPTRNIFLTRKIVGWQTGPMIDVAVIDNPAAAEAVLGPPRERLRAQRAEPRSAAMLAAATGLPRQKVNYHLRALERHGLVELVEERRKGNVTERLLQAAAASYVISPSALAAVAPDPARAPDRLSARWLLALAAQLVRDVGDLITGATRAQRKLATFAMDGTVRFASAADRAAFTAELMQTVTSLVAKYHDERAEAGRDHHLVVAAPPTVTARPDASTAAAPGASTAAAPGAEVKEADS